MAKAQREKLYEELDSTIRDSLLDFVRCGRALKEMRDSQAYIDHYQTFEAYVKAVEGLSISEGRDRIRDMMVFESLQNGGGNLPLPQSRSHVRALANAAVFIEEKTAMPQGGFKKQPIGIKNPQRLKQVWEAAVKKHEQRVVKAIQEGKPKPKLTASVVIDALPNDKKPQHIVKQKLTTTSERIGSRLGEFCRVMEEVLPMEKLLKLSEKEEWKREHWLGLKVVVETAREYLDELSEELAGRV